MNKHLGFNTLNSWKILLNNNKYIITPAHNVIYKKNGILKKSDFAQNANWQIPLNYLNNDVFNSEHDIAFIKNDYLKESDCLKPYKRKTNIIHTDFYFLQPIDFTGKFGQYRLGCMTGIIYQSPNSLLYEGINVGFRGMSGSICVDKNDKYKYIGMFVRLGKNLGSNEKSSTLEMSETKEAKRGMIMTYHLIKKNLLAEKTIFIDDLLRTRN